MRRPLKRLRHCRRRDLLTLLEVIESRGVLAGVFSDYPTQDKLDALGVRQRFSLELCATDASINAFKPHPRGFLAACERWGIPPADVVYVGDRPSIDGAGATAAGMRASIVGRGSGFKHIVQEIFADG
jgi:HAD superfamily hydrolase (TIGR01549 family)